VSENPRAQAKRNPHNNNLNIMRADHGVPHSPKSSQTVDVLVHFGYRLSATSTWQPLISTPIWRLLRLLV
jgi:hypothetical protein